MKMIRNCSKIIVPMANKPKITIDPDTPIAEVAELYPDVVDYLVSEYGFHCVGCFASHFETIRQGAMVHGIYEQDFEVMMVRVNEIANTEK